VTRVDVTVTHARPRPHTPQAVPLPRRSQMHRAARCTTGTSFPRSGRVERKFVGYGWLVWVIRGEHGIGERDELGSARVQGRAGPAPAPAGVPPGYPRS
jgi:hypothetical protein